MDFGYLRISRKFMTNEMWTEGRTFSKAEAWLDLLFMTAYERTIRVVVGFPIELRRGELVASDSFLMKRWRWSRNKVRLFLKTLELEERIQCMDHPQSNQAGRIIHVLNYEIYQAREPDFDPRD
jgi:hypothetical protein